MPKLFLVVSTQRHAFVAGSHAYMSKPEPHVAAQLGASLIAGSSVAFSQIDAASLRLVESVAPGLGAQQADPAESLPSAPTCER